jgi:hypothetical protein
MLRHQKVVKAHLCMFPGTCVPEGIFESSEDLVPIVFVIGGPSSCELVNGPVGPSLHPVFDIRSLDEAQEQCRSFHWVYHLFSVKVGDAEEIELVHELVGHGSVSIEYVWWVAS